jgi:hypothetical protein
MISGKTDGLKGRSEVMTENTQQGFTAADVTGLAATIAAVISLILMTTLPHSSIGFGLAAAASAIILALTSASMTRKDRQPVSWFARIGSAGGAITIIVFLVWEISRS